jgi:hypothetical protein
LSRHGWGTRFGGGVESGEDQGRDLLEGEEGLFDFAFADGGGGDDEGAVGDGWGEGVVAAGVVHDFSCSYGRFGV